MARRYNVTGVDPAYEGQNPHIIKRNFDQSLGITSDCVILRHVLEHVSDPVETVLNISKSIKKEAYFLFEVPRFPSISSLTNRCFPELAARNIYSPDHLHLFSDKSIKIDS